MKLGLSVGITMQSAGKPELISNGDWSNGLTGWTNATTGTGSASVVAGDLVLVGSGAGNCGELTRTVTGLVTGQSYTLRYVVKAGSSMFLNTGGATIISNNFAAGTYSTTFTAASGSFIINPITIAGSTGTMTLDYISLRLT